MNRQNDTLYGVGGGHWVKGRKCWYITDRLGDVPFAVDVSSHTDLRTNRSTYCQQQSNPELNTPRQQESPVQTHPKQVSPVQTHPKQMSQVQTHSKLRFAINQQFWRRRLCWCSNGSLLSVRKLAITTDTRQLLCTRKCWHVII